MVSNVEKIPLVSILRTFRKTASPSWSWRSSSFSSADRSGATCPSGGSMDFSNSRLLILSGYTALDQLIDGLSQAILFRKTSLPAPPRLIRCRRTLESGAPDSRTSIDFIGRLLTSMSSTWVSSSPIKMSPLVAEGDPLDSLIILWLPSLAWLFLSRSILSTACRGCLARHQRCLHPRLNNSHWARLSRLLHLNRLPTRFPRFPRLAGCRFRLRSALLRGNLAAGVHVHRCALPDTQFISFLHKFCLAFFVLKVIFACGAFRLIVQNLVCDILFHCIVYFTNA